MAHNEIVALDPTSGPLDRKDPRAFPERPETLNGAVVGLVANGLGEGQKMMDALYDELNKEAYKSERKGRRKINTFSAAHSLYGKVLIFHILSLCPYRFTRISVFLNH